MGIQFKHNEGVFSVVLDAVGGMGYNMVYYFASAWEEWVSGGVLYASAWESMVRNECTVCISVGVLAHGRISGIYITTVLHMEAEVQVFQPYVQLHHCIQLNS
jgi:hypothetical protein